MDILIRGAGFVNKGAEAMLRTVEQQLGQRIGNACFCMMVPQRRAEQVRAAGFFPIFTKGGKFRKLSSLITVALCDRRILKVALVSPQAALQIKDLKDISAVVDISGFSYSDVWGYESSKFASVLLEYFHTRAKPYFFMPQAWGPFNQPLVARYIKSFCPKANVIYARDQQSYDYLTATLGALSAEIRMAPDIAFRFKAAQSQVGCSLLSKLGVDVGGRAIVGLAPNMRVYERVIESGSENAYLKVMIDIAEYCIEELGAAVVLIPHEIASSGGNDVDDRFLCNAVEAAVESRGKKPIAAMVEDYSAEVIKSVIGHLDLLVGSRYHSLVAALSSRVPAVALGWSHKYVELMRLVALEDYVVDYPKLNKTIVLEKVSDAWAKRKAHKAFLKSCLPAIESEVDAVFDYVAEEIRANR